MREKLERTEGEEGDARDAACIIREEALGDLCEKSWLRERAGIRRLREETFGEGTVEEELDGS